MHRIFRPNLSRAVRAGWRSHALITLLLAAGTIVFLWLGLSQLAEETAQCKKAGLHYYSWLVYEIAQAFF